MNRQILRFLLFFTTVLAIMLGSPRIIFAQESADLLARVNALRASVGVPAYSLNGALSAAAQSQAQWMVDTGTISHTRPDGSGPRTRAAAAGYPSAQVSENIYGGTNATAGDAWTFWINSGIHYAGLVSTNYAEIGIGIARGGWGAAYVLVFGNPGGISLAAASSGGGSGGSRSGASAAPVAPVAYMGIDEAGNIQHLVQPGDTLGDIALIYGYTWDDLPMMMAANSLDNVRDLVPGSIFLVPPKGGTLPPTPDDRPPTETPPPTPLPPTITPFVLPTSTPPLVTPAPADASVGLSAYYLEQTVVFTPDAPALGANGASVLIPTPIPTSELTNPAVTLIAAAPTLQGDQPSPAAAPPASQEDSRSTLLVIALGTQVVVLLGAGVEFARRSLRRR
ncbi:MAG: CAP domain-containing protein [Anaerolineae bacterium]|nr:CAP domain-containing protein [Anaerolineae bacterium]NUQ03209.1 LysM peptidoglycan-binding domain-containing protein [Anaerolineae bacterium]